MPVLIQNNSCVSLHFAIGSQTEINTKEPRLHKQSLITYPCEKPLYFPTVTTISKASLSLLRAISYTTLCINTYFLSDVVYIVCKSCYFCPAFSDLFRLNHIDGCVLYCGFISAKRIEIQCKLVQYSLSLFITLEYIPETNQYYALQTKCLARWKKREPLMELELTSSRI